MRLRRATWLALPLLFVAPALAACSSSSSSSSASTPTTAPASAAASTSGSSSAAASGGSLKSGLKVFVIPKNLGNSYFTTSDSVNSGGALAALQTLSETASETSGTADTPSSQIPAIQAAISKGANALVISATDPTALCPTLKSAMARGIKVVTYDSDAPTCRSLFINQATAAGARRQRGRPARLADRRQRPDRDRLGLGRRRPTRTPWISYMKQELKKYPKMSLVSTVYGNDDPPPRPR